MSQKIVLTVEASLNPSDIEEIKGIIVNALENYIAQRSPASEYVAKRYPWYQGVLSERVMQVMKKNYLAKKLIPAVSGLHTEESAVPELMDGGVNDYTIAHTLEEAVLMYRKGV